MKLYGEPGWGSALIEAQLDWYQLDYEFEAVGNLFKSDRARDKLAEINPVAEITAKVRSAGAISVVDGVSYAPHGVPNVAALGADVYLFSAYKTHGPHQGVMTVRHAAADRLAPQCHWFNEGDRMSWFTPAGPDQKRAPGPRRNPPALQGKRSKGSVGSRSWRASLTLRRPVRRLS